MASLALVFRPSTTPSAISPLALNQFRRRGRCMRKVLAKRFIGGSRDRITRAHHLSRNQPAQGELEYVQKASKDSLSRKARTLRRSYWRTSLNLLRCLGVLFSLRFRKHQRGCFGI